MVYDVVINRTETKLTDIISMAYTYGKWRKEKSTEAWEEYKKSKQNTKKGYFVSKGKETEGMCKRSK